LTRLLHELVAIEILGNFDLDVAEIALTGYTFAFLLFGVGGFLRSWRAAFESAVPVV
jgi:hypothetical protein